MLVVVATLGLVACSGDDDADSAVASDDGSRQGSDTGANAGDPWADIPDIVDDVVPSVVAIFTSDAEGSGVIYHDDGVIVTNAHVVGDAETVEVRFADGSQAEADVVARDPVVDLAVVRTDRNGLPAATFAEDEPQVGELAVALGSPLGFENTATAGIVSGLERSIPGGGQQLAGLIQTDAAISPGNSGGALVGPAGDIVGINVAYIPPQGGAVSIGFAIPSPLVVDVADQLLANGEVQHAALGITPVTLTPQLAERYGIEAQDGALVLEVQPGGPADTAGIQPGDVIVSFGGDDVHELGDLLTALRSSAPGDHVELGVLRDGKDETIEVELGKAPQPDQP